MKNQAEVVNQAKNNNQAAIKSLEIRSKTEEEATKKAIEQLNVNKDDIENIKVEVIEEPNKGFLGFIGAKDGLYKITVTAVSYTHLSWIGVFVLFKYSTNSLIPPSYKNSFFCSCPGLLSSNTILTPLFKNANSLNLVSNVL